jgi:small subunit ribosomal protein S2
LTLGDFTYHNTNQVSHKEARQYFALTKIQRLFFSFMLSLDLKIIVIVYNFVILIDSMTLEITAKESLKQMKSAGMHFGHQTRKWNPKMEPFIFGKKNGIHIINLVQTYFYYGIVSSFLTLAASQGQTFLFVGTKKQGAQLIAKAARRCDSFYVNQRWLGGMLTNWRTIRTSIQRLVKLEKTESLGGFANYPKKEAAALIKEKQRLHKYLGGVKGMTKRPDVVIIIGQSEEMHAVYECQKLGIPCVTILDTDCDPSLTDFFIPANDDSIASIQWILTGFIEAIQKGQKNIQ